MEAYTNGVHEWVNQIHVYPCPTTYIMPTWSIQAAWQLAGWTAKFWEKQALDLFIRLSLNHRLYKRQNAPQCLVSDTHGHDPRQGQPNPGFLSADES